MKKVISIFVAVTMIFSSITTAFATDFSDINGHWAESTINKWKDKEIITGYPDGTFKPDDPVTRAELAKILTEAFELKEKTSLEEYDDMDSSSWYYPYVQCSEKYIPVSYISTTKKGVYNPDGQVQIFIQNAQKGVDMSVYNAKEHEVLYARNSTFKVLNKIKKDGKYYILLEEK